MKEFGMEMTVTIQDQSVEYVDEEDEFLLLD